MIPNGYLKDTILKDVLLKISILRSVICINGNLIPMVKLSHHPVIEHREGDRGLTELSKSQFDPASQTLKRGVNIAINEGHLSGVDCAQCGVKHLIPLRQAQRENGAITELRLPTVVLGDQRRDNCQQLITELLPVLIGIPKVSSDLHRGVTEASRTVLGREIERSCITHDLALWFLPYLTVVADAINQDAI